MLALSAARQLYILKSRKHVARSVYGLNIVVNNFNANLEKVGMPKNIYHRFVWPSQIIDD